MGEVVEFPRHRCRSNLAAATAELRGMTIAELRWLWDTCEDGESDGYCIEDIHAEINRRGDGLYCAV